MTHKDAPSGRDLANGFRVYRQLNRSRGWQATFRVVSTVYFKYFADADYGSPKAAKKAAEQFAGQNIELHHELAALRRRFYVRANSRSGLPGVARYDGNASHGPFWLAYWDDEHGRRVSRRFSIGRYGEVKAFNLARKAREKGVRPFRERYQQILVSLGLVEKNPDGLGVKRRRN